MAAFVAFGIMLTAFLSGNAIQANSIADLMNSEFAIPMWLSGTISAAVVGLVILGGIQRIGKVTSIIAPFMALLYVVGGLLVLGINADMVWPSFQIHLCRSFQSYRWHRRNRGRYLCPDTPMGRPQRPLFQ